MPGLRRPAHSVRRRDVGLKDWSGREARLDRAPASGDAWLVNRGYVGAAGEYAVGRGGAVATRLAGHGHARRVTRIDTISRLVPCQARTSTLGNALQPRRRCWWGSAT